MGKIFKALKKAEKENVAKPTQQPAPNQLKRDLDKAEITAEEKPGADPNYQAPVVAREPQHPKPTRPSAESKAAVRADIRTATKAESLTMQALESLPHRLEQSPPRAKFHPEKEQQAQPAESRPAQVSDASPNPEGVNIALIKREENEPPVAVQRLNQEPAAGEISANIAEPADAMPRKSIQVRYSKTKIQASDPKKLRNNQVLSIFEGIETSNQFKILRTQVLRKLKACGGNSILVTSANQYEGKTFTSINLGVSIAKEFDRTVLIIDADIRRPTRQHTDFSTEFFSLNVEKGLTDYLAGDVDIEDILINPGIDKLTLIPGGMPVDNSPELLNSARMERMMTEIKSRYPSDRLVIVDGPAILHFPDAMILYRYVDGVLPVVEVEKTSSDDLKKMMNHLKEVNILGLVFNKNKS